MQRFVMIPALLASVVASGACTVENLSITPPDLWMIPIVPALMVGVSAIRPRTVGLVAIGFAAPLYGVGLWLQTNLHNREMTAAAFACGVAVVLGAVAALGLWRSDIRKAAALGKFALGFLAAAGYVALVLSLYPISG